MRFLQIEWKEVAIWKYQPARVAGLVFYLLGASVVWAADPFAWTPRTPCPLVRYEAVGGAAAGKLYQFSGYYTSNPPKATPRCDAYDPGTNSWIKLADIPQPISHCGQVVDDQPVDDQTFWLAGGFVGDHPGPSTNQVWKYSIKNDTWSAGPPLPAQRAGGALVRLGRELHYFGGVVRANGVYVQDYGTHWAFDLDGGTAWRTTTPDGQLLAPMPNPRNHMGGVALNGKIYAIGGQHLGDEITALNEVDVYDPATNAWAQVAPMPRPLGHITANVFVRNGRIDITSGVTSNSVEIANVIEYNPLTNTWSELPALPAARQSPVSGSIGDQIIVTSGDLSGLKAQTWVTTPVGALPTPWMDQDLGVGGMGGSASSSDYWSSFSITGSGPGIGGNDDGFHYMYQSLNGNGQIVVRVATQQNTSAAAQAGVMIRETLDATSKHAAMLITPGNGVLFQRRLLTGGATSQTVASGAGIVAPYWLKLVRSGNTLTGYRTSTGSNWTRLGSSTVSMGANVLIGLAVSSSTNAVNSTATFTNLNLGPKANAGPDQTVVLPNSVDLVGAAIDDGLPAGSLKFTWSKVSGPGTVTFSSANAPSTRASFGVPGTYTLRLTAGDSKLSATDNVVITATAATSGIKRYLYVAVTGGGIKVYDLDNGHALVKSLQPVSTTGEIRGICAAASTARLYVAYRTAPGRMYALDLLTDKVVFDRSYPPDVDRMDIAADDRQIYMPPGENTTADFNYVIDAMTGDVITKIPTAAKPHDTLCSAAGPRAYLETVTSKYVSVVDTRTNQVSRVIGPFGDAVRPFVFNADETLMFANVNNFFGFEVANMTTGKVIHRVPVTGFNYTPKTLLSHGVGLTPDGKELWVCDSTNSYIHVFNVAQLPPTQIASIALSGGTSHWVSFSIDGRFAYPAGPHGTTKPVDVIDTQTKRKVASIPASRNIVEVDFDGGKVVKVGKQFGIGR